MNDLTTTDSAEAIPSAEDMARRISDEPDEAVLRMARAMRSRLIVSREMSIGRPCTTCRHRISPGATPAYVGMCTHPLATEISYRPDRNVTRMRMRYCSDERSHDRGGTSPCGPAGLLHEPVAMPRLMPRLRAYVRWMLTRHELH